MLMYDKLAAYYDALVKDEEATAAWVDFVKRHAVGHSLLEVACGSGEITLALAKAGYHMTAGDISEEMLKQAQAKPNSEAVAWHRLDMRDLQAFGTYDSILCFCDSVNYLIDFADWRAFFHQAYEHLNDHGVLLFDMHSIDRLAEFSEEYCEAGYINDTAYEWTINTEGELIYHNFVFYNEEAQPALEQHVQRVMEPDFVMKCLNDIGFHVDVMTDFIKSGIQNGEKYFYICRK